jgi:hypothetical protein
MTIVNEANMSKLNFNELKQIIEINTPRLM